MTNWPDKFSACLLGTAAGDALGLPREGLSPQRAQRLFGTAPLHHRLLFNRGMISDDTEHACLTAQALLAARNNPDAFASSLAWRLRGWLLALPAGIGFATLRATLKLCLGFTPHRSGVRSAGNGPAMRAPILGLWMAATNMAPDCRDKFLRAATRITHTDDRALEGSTLIARVTAHAATQPITAPTSFLETLLHEVQGDELRKNLALVQHHLHHQSPMQSLAADLGLQRGITGYINHTLPAALFAFLRWPNDFRRPVEEVILAGGDTDSTAALVGALAGTALGTAAIPQEWLTNLRDFPRSTSWIQSLAHRLAHQAANPQTKIGPQPLFWPALLLRNPFFTTIILAHGFRRLLPPY